MKIPTIAVSLILAIILPSLNVNSEPRLLYVPRDDRPTSCDDEKSVIVFGNGVNTDKTRALVGRAALNTQFESHLNSTGLKSTFGEYKTASAFYPTLGNFLADTIISVAPQAAALNISQVARWAKNLETGPEWLQEKLSSAAAAADRLAVASSPAAQNHANSYDDILNLGRNLVVVGHSYGTIISNIAYLALEDFNLPGFTLVQVAIMDTEISGHDRFGSEPLPYTTQEEDLVAFIYRIVDPVPGNLLGNVDNYPGDTFGGVDKWGGHSFEADYMNAYAPGPGNGLPNARTKIMGDIIRMHGLAKPKPCRGHIVSGAGAQPDGNSTQVSVNNM